MTHFKQKRIAAMLAPLGLVAGMALVTQGAVAAENNRYATDTSSSVVRNTAGECWLTIGGIDRMLPECGDVIDSDGDGVFDDKDMCPGTPKGAPVDARGCPLDSDGDLVPDYQDKCPGTPRGAKVDANGCEIKAPAKAMPAPIQKVVISNVLLFDFDSAALKPGAVSALDNAYAKFKKNDNVDMVIITGHTDSMGSDAYNQGLSEHRANAVRDYLIGEGANPENLGAGGKGESKPVDTNDTKEGRQNNRRVEFRAIMKK